MSSVRLNVPSPENVVDTPKRNQLTKQLCNRISAENILGRGSYGVVFKGVYKGKPVAVKVLDSSDPLKMKTLENEANFLGCKHKNLIEVLQVDSNVNYGMVIMELFQGQCLHSILDLVEIPIYHRIWYSQWHRFFKLLSKLCVSYSSVSLDISNALNYCHERDLVHLDVKPQNVMVAFTSDLLLTKSNSIKKAYICKLCDFGSSLKLKDTSKEPVQILGTIRYMAPEALKKEQVTRAADIYSLGITMWQIKERQYPYEWIARNETVAYKVVKNNLRPNFMSPINNRKFLSPRNHSHCICEHFSSNKKINLKSNPNIDDALLPTTISKSLSPFQRKNRIAPFTNKTNKLNTTRIQSGEIKSRTSLDVAMKTVDSRTPKETIPNPGPKIVEPLASEIFEEKKTVEIDLNEIFQNQSNIFRINVDDVEKTYETIYKSCWECDPLKRPNSSELIQLLKSILK